MNNMLVMVVIVGTALLTYGIMIASASTINVYSSTAGVTLPISNISNLTGSVQCGGTDKIMNISLTDLGISVLCDTDQVGGAGTLSSFNSPYLYNISNQGYFNSTYANLSNDLRYVLKNAFQIPYTNLTGTILLTQANITNGISLPYNNLTGTVYLTQSNITNGISLPLVNVSGSSSTQCSSTDQRAYNLTLSNGVLSIQCGTDATGGAGDTSVGQGYLYNQSQNMYLNDTLLNATYDTRYLRSVLMPYTNLTGTIVIGYNNLTGTASLGYNNLTGTIAITTANITSGTLDDARLSTNITSLKTGITALPVANLTAGTLGAGWTWNGNVITSAYIGSHTLSYSNLTGNLAIGYTNLTGTVSLGYNNLTGTASLGYLNLSGTASIGYTNLTGTVSLTPANITGLANSHLHAYTNLTGTLSLGQANLTGLTLPIANITAGTAPAGAFNFANLNATSVLNVTGYVEIDNTATTQLRIVNSTCGGIRNNGTFLIIGGC